MKPKTAIVAVLIGAAALVLAGCGTVYEKDTHCPGYIEDDEKCQDLIETYHNTHDFDRDDYRRRLRSQEDGDGPSRRSDTTPPRRAVGYKPYMEGEAHPRPILTQAVPVRVFIDPYEDNSGRLHTPGYVYVRASEPKWIFGQQETSDSRTVTPLVADD